MTTYQARKIVELTNISSKFLYTLLKIELLTEKERQLIQRGHIYLIMQKARDGV